MNTEPRSTAREFVRFALNIGALELLPEGRKLKSGRMSPYFFNSGLFNTGHRLSVLAGAYAAAVYTGGSRPDVIFGPAYKGIPLVAAVAVRLGNSIEYAFDRKEEKDHGEGGVVVGASLNGKKVTIIDDVMTTGKSIIEAAEIIRQEGGTPVGCVIAFDRQERVEGELSAVQEFEQKNYIPVCASATLDDLIWVLNDQLENDEQLDDLQQFRLDLLIEKILAYKTQYGAAL
ncbi:MAG: orotate phosphoribosyltransferase [Candidatus Pacebacteria bacterium]|nr:orotate phosphoribosyltransferase [Candidatus Paceibacterota bacterium]MCF7857648.1 orotate phosphoribosyltransferase [Candidatus Paceibacterota bacterium]